MKNFILLEGEFPIGFKNDFEVSLFNRAAHRLAQAPIGWQSFYMVKPEKKKVYAACHFHIHEEVAKSPLKAPFGSIEFSKALHAKDLFEFLDQIVQRLKTLGVKVVSLKNSPTAFHPESSSTLNVLLLNYGFRITNAEINSTIELDYNMFEDRVQPSKKRKLNQAKKIGLKFSELPIGSLKDIYQFIARCRSERDQSLSMELHELEKTIAACPEDFVLFGVYHKGILIAATVAVKVTKNILYNFYPAHSRKHDLLSPVITLTEGMYVWCKKNGYNMLDLGTSAIDNHPNYSLLDFKKDLGSYVSMKITFEKTLMD